MGDLAKGNGWFPALEKTAPISRIEAPGEGSNKPTEFLPLFFAELPIAREGLLGLPRRGESYAR